MDLRVVFFLAVLGLVQCHLINLGCDGIKKFVDGHNSRRLQLAKGQVPGQPAAKKMNKMIWDEELAKKSADWADREEYGHNPDRTIPSDRFIVGENIYLYSTTSDEYEFDPEKAMASWFDEHTLYQHKPLTWKDFAPGVPAIGHYTQMAWSDSTYIGCAISEYSKDRWNNFYVVCNYGPLGNYIHETPYKKGKASQELTCGTSDCSRLYGDSCSV